MKQLAAVHSSFTRTRGFSLTEVAIALAVAGVALMSVVGLIPSLMDSEQGSGANTAITALATQALGDARSKPYGTTPPQPYSIYFTQDGKLLSDTSSGTAVYTCKITQSAVVPDSGATSATPGTHCRVVTMEFTWPVGAAVVSNRNRRIIYATLPES